MKKRLSFILTSFYFLSLLMPAKKTMATSPTTFSAVTKLSTYQDCQNKAAEVASFVLSNYKINTGSNNTIIAGTTADAAANLTCVKKNSGSYFVVLASSEFEEEEARSIVERVISFMRERKATGSRVPTFTPFSMPENPQFEFFVPSTTEDE